MTFRKTVQALAASILCCGLLASAASAATELKHWPKEARAKIEAMIRANAHQGQYATFDMDQTTYRYDLLDPLLAYMDQKGLLTRETMDPAMKIIPFRDSPEFEGGKENMTSYYWRLCEMLALKQPIKRQVWDGDKVVTVELPIPRMFRGMQELYAKLRENGIDVYIMTAAHEEIIRMVASDPKYGYNIDPEKVIGVTVLLKDPKTGELTTSRMQISEGRYDQKKNLDLVTTSFLTNPMTWFEGKQGSTIGYINQWQRPIMAAGDSTGSDTYMLESVNVERGGIKLWINRKPGNPVEDKKARWTIEHADKSAAEQNELNMPVTANKNWIFIDPDTIM